MKNWKKLLVCLLVGLMALTVFTACDASVGAPMGPERSTAESAQKLCDNFKVSYSEELSEKAYYFAYWVAQNSGACLVNKEQTTLSRKDNIGNEAKAQMKLDRYADAFDIMGIGKGIGGGMGANDFVPGFYFDDPELEVNGPSDITFVLPKDGIFTKTMTDAAKGKTKLGVAYVVRDGVSYAVVLFGD